MKTNRHRVFNIMQYLSNPKTGEVLITREQIEKGLKHKSIKRHALILHDKDVYTEKDETEHIKTLTKQYNDLSEEERKQSTVEDYIKNNQYIFAGKLKPPHYHIVLECPNTQELEVIATWFGVPMQYIELPKGRDAFLDCVQYLTHESEKEQKAGKTLYDDSEVEANFDFRTELNEREENRLKYGRDLSPRDKMRFDVLYNGKTLRQCMAEDRIGYMNDIEKLRKLRLEHIHNQPAPPYRLNFYIQGRGGVGKGLFSRAIARSLFSEYEDDNDIFFEINAKDVGFEGYDGQPVIIWNDYRAVNLLDTLNDRGNVFNVFDPHPTKARQNIKYGSISLTNVVNIVNSVQDYKDFLNGLAGEYTDKNYVTHKSEDKGQSYRRFPFIIPLHEDDFDMYVNKGFVDNSDAFGQYYMYMNFVGNMQRVRVACGANEQLAKNIETRIVQPITDKYNEVVENMETVPEDEETIMKMFKDYGKPRAKINDDFDWGEYNDEDGNTIING